jgi:DNA-binding LytR/AlgR family response regulator
MDWNHGPTVLLGTRRAKPRRLPAIRQFVLRNASGEVTVPVEDIDLIHGGAGRLRLVQGPTVYFAHGRLSDVSPRLDQRFIRISRSALVNVASVRRCATEGNDEIVLYLRGNRRAVVTRRYAKGALHALRELLPGGEQAEASQTAG